MNMQTTSNHSVDNNIIALSKKELKNLEKEYILAWNNVLSASITQSFSKIKRKNKDQVEKDVQEKYQEYKKVTEKVNKENVRYVFAKVTDLLINTDLYTINIELEKIDGRVSIFYEYATLDENNKELNYNISNKLVDKYMKKKHRYLYEKFAALVVNLETDEDEEDKVYKFEFNRKTTIENFLKQFNLNKKIDIDIETDMTQFE